MFLTRQQGHVLFVVLMATSMSFIMSLAMTALNAPLDAHFMQRWFRSFLVGALVAIPSAMIVVPVMRRIADSLTASR